MQAAPCNDTALEGATVAHAILDTLLAHGVDTVFGVPGSAISAVFDACADRGVKLVTFRQETSAVFAAMGHARITGRPALVLVTSGPGFTNAVTGLCAAHAERLPVILIAGDVSTDQVGRFALQDGADVEVLSLARSVARLVARIAVPSAAQGLVLAALRTPGPSVLTLPLDVSRARVGPLRIADTCEAVARRMRAARRPLIVLGAGARAAPSVVTLAERTGAMVVATAHAKGAFPERHRNYLGVIGFGGHSFKYSPDFTLVMGSRLSDIATAGFSFRGEVVQVDRDPSVLGRNVGIELGVVADVEDAAAAIAAQFQRDVPPAGESLAGARGLLAELQRGLPDDTIYTVDIGEHAAYAVHHLRVDRSECFHLNAALGSMGSGMCSAIGIKRARPDRAVVAIVGDGGFLMHAGELLTCVEARIGVVFVVFNDGRYRMCDLGFEKVYGRVPPGMPSRRVELCALAEAFGARGVLVNDARDLRFSLSDVPVVLDVRIETEGLSVSTRTRTVFR
jgi:acetolactate synthase I/II/III large subunit